MKKLFPEAIEHKRRRESRNCQFYSDQDCPVCREERESVDTLKHAIQSWASTTREDPALKTLLDRKRTQAREHEAYNFTTATNGCRLVHKTDIITWREAVKTLANPQKIIGNSSDQIRSFSENLVFPSCHKVVLEFENEPIDKLVASIRSFICREHDLVVENAILGKVASSGSNEVQKLASYVTVVTKDEYHSYITSLATLLRILRTDVGQKSSSIMSPMALDQEESFIGYVRQVASSHHPLIRTLSEVGRTGKNSLKFIHDGSVKEFHLSPPMCDHETCVKECALLVVVEDKDNNDDHIENISVDSFDDKPSARKAVASLGSGNSDPIVVESDAEDSKKTATFLMRVFELEAGATQDQAMEALHNASVISSDIAASSELRRSTRKRKPKFPFGVLLREDSVNVSLHHNVAAICLFMYESCGIPANYSKLFLVLTPEFEKSSISETSPFDSESQVSLSELIQRMRGGKLDDEHFDHKKHTLLLHQRDPGDSNCQHEALVEALFQCSNIDGDHASLNRNEDRVGSRKKSRPSERGFQGTLLQSGNPPSASTEHGDDDSVIQGHPEAPAISEDEHQEPTMVVDDSSPPASRSSSRPSNAVRNQMILSDDSDEDSVSKSPPTSGVDIEDEPTKELMTIVDTSDTERENASARDKLSVDTFSSLKAIVRRPNATKIWDAVLWAFSQNPTVNDASVLLDIAYAKYLSNSESA